MVHEIYGNEEVYKGQAWLKSFQETMGDEAVKKLEERNNVVLQQQ